MSLEQIELIVEDNLMDTLDWNSSGSPFQSMEQTGEAMESAARWAEVWQIVGGTVNIVMACWLLKQARDRSEQIGFMRNKVTGIERQWQSLQKQIDDETIEAEKRAKKMLAILAAGDRMSGQDERNFGRLANKTRRNANNLYKEVQDLLREIFMEKVKIEGHQKTAQGNIGNAAVVGGTSIVMIFSGGLGVVAMTLYTGAGAASVGTIAVESRNLTELNKIFRRLEEIQEKAEKLKDLLHALDERNQRLEEQMDRIGEQKNATVSIEGLL